MKSRKRLMQLAGISIIKEEVSPKDLEEDTMVPVLGMNDEVQWDDTVQGFDSILQNADESDEDVESLESINKRAGFLYPGKKYYGMHAGEHMNESIDYIDKLEDKDNIDLPNII